MSDEAGKREAPEAGGAKAARVEDELREGTMTVTQRTEETMSPKLAKVMERAKREPEAQFTSLAHLLDQEALGRAFHHLRDGAAVGGDGVTKEQYGQELESNIAKLHAQLKTMSYRHQPLRRVHIPKGDGKTRPIGISCVEDKVVQEGLRELLDAVYEPLFLECSYGFRRGRSAHDALRAMDRWEGGVSVILEADIKSYFDNIDRKMLMEMLRQRVVDTSLLRLVGKCLHVGILDGEEYSEPERGTAQGSVLSPLLGNVYLHHVLDLWFERDVRPRLRGKAHLVRYADDFVMGFEREDDAKRVMEVLRRRFERFGLTLHPEKTRVVPFARPPSGTSGGKGPSTFDFLGFTHYWRQTQRGAWTNALKTRSVRLRRAITAVADWCRSHRHEPVKEQHAALKRRLVGHYNYFGVNGNMRSLRRLVRATERGWWKWLSRRGQRSPTTWARFRELLRVYPLPNPTIRIQMWSS